MAQRKDEVKFKRHKKVIAAVELPGVPAGTEGKVQVINGFSWVRYWVRFANGVELGQLSNDQLATPDEWADLQARRRQAARRAERDARRQTA